MFLDGMYVVGFLVGAGIVAVVAILTVVLPIAGFFIGIAVGAEWIAKTRQWATFKEFLGAGWLAVRQLLQFRHRLPLHLPAELRKEEGQ